MKGPVVVGTPLLVHQLVGYHAARTPNARAATDSFQTLNFMQLNAVIDDWAKALIGAGVSRGDRVLVMLPPSVDYFVSVLAVASLGACWVGLDPRHRSNEFIAFLEDSDPILVITVGEFDGRDYRDELRAADMAERAHFCLQSRGRTEFLKLGRDVSDQDLALARATVRPEDCAIIVYTSGTTGAAKGAMLSHRAITSAALANVAMHGRNQFEAAVCAFAPNHVGAINNLCAVVLAAGGCIHFHPRLDIAAMARIHAAERITYAIAAPTVFHMLLDQPQHNYLLAPSVRLVAMGGAATPLDLLKRLPVGENLRFSSVYGQTETCGMITATPSGATLVTHADTFGKGLPGVELRLGDADGDLGELQVRGPVLMNGYLGKTQATSEAFTPDGWLRTGDQCSRDVDGNFAFIGRLKEMFKSGGYNIYPLEVERALLDHPDVIDAVVVPVPDARYQEVGHAFVVRRPEAAADEAGLKAFLKERIAGYKVPRVIRFEAALPLLPNTKIDRQTLRQQAQQGALQTGHNGGENND